VEASVDDKPARTKKFAAKLSQSAHRIILVPAILGCETLGVKYPAFGAGRQTFQPADQPEV
jgi:hypothetical protein